MTLQARTVQSGGLSSPSKKVRTTPTKPKKKYYTYEEVFGDIVIQPFTLKDALAILQITESEFQEQLYSGGFCKKENFDREGVFPVEWIVALDTQKWSVD